MLPIIVRNEQSQNLTFILTFIEFYILLWIFVSRRNLLTVTLPRYAVLKLAIKLLYMEDLLILQTLHQKCSIIGNRVGGGLWGQACMHANACGH